MAEPVKRVFSVRAMVIALDNLPIEIPCPHRSSRDTHACGPDRPTPVYDVLGLGFCHLLTLDIVYPDESVADILQGLLTILLPEPGDHGFDGWPAVFFLVPELADHAPDQRLVGCHGDDKTDRLLLWTGRIRVLL